MEDFAAHTAPGSVAHGLVKSAADCYPAGKAPAAPTDLVLAVALNFAAAFRPVAPVVEIVAEPAPVLAGAVPVVVSGPVPVR